MLNGIDVEDLLTLMTTELLLVNNGYNPDIKPTGDNVMITCPYHKNGQERKPSMGVAIDKTITTEKGTCHCFTCGRVVSLPTLISDAFGYDDFGSYGNKWIAKQFYSYSDERPEIQIIPEEKTVFEETGEYFYNPLSLPYLTGRKISEDIIRKFEIDYDIQDNAIIFPVKDKSGQVLFTQRRFTKAKIFMNSEGADKAATLYGIDKVYEIVGQLDRGTHLYVVESIIDALYLWSNGYIAVASMQAQASEKQLRLLKELPIYNIVLAQDNDSAGITGANKMRDELKDKHLARLIFPAGCKDVNDMSIAQVLSHSISYIF